RAQLVFDILPGKGLRAGLELRVLLRNSNGLTIGGGLALQALGCLAGAQSAGQDGRDDKVTHWFLPLSTPGLKPPRRAISLLNQLAQFPLFRPARGVGI